MAADVVGHVVSNNTGAAVGAVTLDPTASPVGGAIATGDLMFITVCGAAGVVPSVPAGWTLVGRGNFGTRYGGVFYRIRQSGDTSYAFSVPSGQGQQSTLTWVRGHDALLDGFILGAWANRGSALTYTDVPGVTPPKANSLILTFALEATSAPESDITSCTFGTKVFFEPQTTSPQIHTTYLNKLLQTTAAATGTNRISYPGSAVANGAGVMVAIPPATDTPVLPDAAFQSARTGLVVEFEDTSTSAGDPITAWDWDFGDGGSSTAQNPTHIYSSSDTYTVELTVTNADGPDSITHSVVIPDPPESNPGAYTFYDAFSRYTDTTDPEGWEALTGQVWQMYSGPGVVTDGLYDSVKGTGASYPFVPTTDEVTRMGMTFRFDNEGGARTGTGPTALLMVWDNIANPSNRNTRCHAALTPGALGIDTRRGGPNVLTRIVSAAISPALALNVDHEYEVLLDGDNIKIYVDGVLRIDHSDATFADSSDQRQAVFEPFYNSDATDPRVRIGEVWAVWGVQPFPGYIGDDRIANAYYNDGATEVPIARVYSSDGVTDTLIWERE